MAGCGRVLGGERSGAGKDPFFGADGLASCLLSVLVAAASCGVTLAVALWQVLGAARRASTAPSGAARWIVVLGSRLEDGRPGPAFRVRLDRARALADARPALPIAVLGGVTDAGRTPEGEAGLRYLAEAGIPPARLVAEVGSRHTLENLRAFRAAFPRDEAGGQVLVLVTSRSHLARACAMGRGLGLDIVPCAAEADASPLPARELRRLPVEAFLLHWYAVGSGFATLTRNRALLRRIR
jgi:uncharacterized SAM-binding protein YcdF (DUF218 family)